MVVVNYDLYAKNVTFWKDLTALRARIDSSNYAITHPWFQESPTDEWENLLYFQKKNKKKLGLLKDEAPLNPKTGSSCFILSSTSLRLKMYNIEYDEPTIALKNVCKGIPRKVAERYSVLDYRRAVEKGGMSTVEHFHSIRQLKNCLYIMLLYKKGISSIDFKRKYTDDGLDSVAFGFGECNKLLS